MSQQGAFPDVPDSDESEAGEPAVANGVGGPGGHTTPPSAAGLAGLAGAAIGAASSAAAAGAAAAPATVPDLQTMMAMMLQQNQATLNMMASQQTPARSSPGPYSPGLSQSPLAKAVDLRGMLKCEEYHGDKTIFQDWKRTFYSTVDLVNAGWATRAKEIEKDIDKTCWLSSMTAEERSDASGLYTFLLHLCKGDAATKVAAGEEYNGFDAWRMLCRAYLARSATVALSSLMYPKFPHNDARVNLQQWDREAQRYEDRFGEKVPDGLRMTVYQDKIAPPEVLEHLLLNRSR